MKIHLPGNGEGARDARLERVLFPMTLSAGTNFVARKTIDFSTGAGTINTQFWTTPSQDYQIEQAYVRLTANWTRATAGVSISASLQFESTGGAYTSLTSGTLASADFLANMYDISTKQALWGLKTTDRIGFADGPAVPIDRQLSPMAMVFLGTQYKGKIARMSIVPSNGTDGMSGSLEVILVGKMLA